MRFCLSQLEPIKLRILKAQSEAKSLRVKLEELTEKIDEMVLQKAGVIIQPNSADELVETLQEQEHTERAQAAAAQQIAAPLPPVFPTSPLLVNPRRRWLHRCPSHLYLLAPFSGQWTQSAR